MPPKMMHINLLPCYLAVDDVTTTFRVCALFSLPVKPHVVAIVDWIKLAHLRVSPSSLLFTSFQALHLITKMVFKNFAVSAFVAWLAAAAPAPQAQSSAPAGRPSAANGPAGGVPTPTANPAQYSSMSAYASSLMASAVAVGSASQAPASLPAPSAPIAPIISSQVTGVTSHGPYRGPAPTTTGAPQSGPAAPSIPALPPNPTAVSSVFNVDTLRKLLTAYLDLLQSNW